MFYSIFRWVSITSNYNSTAFYLKQLLSFITCFKSNKLFAFIPPWLLPQVFILGLPLVFQFPINLCGLSLTPYVPSTLTHDQVLRISCQHSPWDNHNQLNSLKINMIQLWAKRHNPGRLNSTVVLGARRSPVGQRCAPSLSLGLSRLGNEGVTMSWQKYEHMEVRGIFLQFILKQGYWGVRPFFGSLNL